MDEGAGKKVDRLRRAVSRLTKGEQATSGRVPPGQHVVNKLPVLHYGAVPSVDPAHWDLQAYGLVENPLTLTYDEVRALPATRVVADIHCVTRWTLLDTVWEGALFRDLATRVRPLPAARFVMAHAEHGFTTSVPLRVLMGDDVLLAYRYADAELTPAHGYPLRLVVPRLYFWKSAKWLWGLEFMAEDRLGFWERNGYNNSADPWKEERFA